MWHFSNVLISDYFFFVFDIQNVLFHISGSQTSVYMRIIWNSTIQSVVQELLAV